MRGREAKVHLAALTLHFNGASRVFELADVINVPSADGTNMGRFDGGHRNGSARELGKLHLVGRAVLVDVNHRSYITCLEIFFGQVGRQNDAIMLLNHVMSATTPSEIFMLPVPGRE